MGRNRIYITEKIQEITPEIQKALASTGYSGETIKTYSDFQMLKNFKNEIGYTGIGDKSSKRKKNSFIGLAKKFSEIESQTVNEDISEY